MGIIQSAVNKSIGTIGTLASLKKLSDQPNLEELKKRREKAQLKAFAKKQEKSTQQAESDAFKKLFMEGVPLTMRAKKES